MKHFKPAKQYFVLTLLIAYSFSTNAQSSLLNSSVIYQTEEATDDVSKKSKKAVTDTIPQKAAVTQSTTIQNTLRNDVDDTVIENRLVQLALAQPNYAQTLNEQKIFEYQLKKQRSAWLNLLTLSTTYNDQSFAKPTNAGGTTAYVYPKFYIGVNIPLGLIASNSTDVKITKESEKIAKSQQAELAKTIRANVLSNYKQYKANEKLLVIQNQAVDDEQANFLSAEQKFRNGTITLEAYNEASKKYNDEVIKVINLQLQQDLIKLELERLIGRRLEDVIK